MTQFNAILRLPQGGFAPYRPDPVHGLPWHRAWVEHRRFNRLEGHHLTDVGLSLADRATVTVEIIFQRMQRGL